MSKITHDVESRRIRPLAAVVMALALLVAAAAPGTAQTPAPGSAGPLARVGSYRFKRFTSPQQIDAVISLSLFPDNGAALVELSADDLNVAEAVARGVWEQKGDNVRVVVYSMDGKQLPASTVVDLTFDGQFPVKAVVDGQPEDVTGVKFTLGSGDTHPAMRELNRRLSRIPSLGYADPGPSGDIFSEKTRTAVVKFQESQGLLPTGYVDAGTWRALSSPKALAPVQPTSVVQPTRVPPAKPGAQPTLVPTRVPPVVGAPSATPALVPTSTPHAFPTQPSAPATACSPQARTTGVVNLRPYPTTDIAAIGTIPFNTVVPVLGRNADASWYQVNYNGSAGWSFGDLLLVTCVETVPVVNVAVPTPTPAPPPPAQPSGGAPPPTGDKVVYLTFDDGPSGSWTPQILDVLNKYGVKATFFSIGQQIGPQLSLARRLVGDGHALANHTWNHPSLSGLPQDQFNQQMQSTRSAIVEAGGHRNPAPNCMRPPYGATDANTKTWAAQNGYNVYLWTIDTMDWSLPGTEQIINTVLSEVKPGSIILQHDGGGNRAQTVAAIDAYIPLLQQQGYRFDVGPCL